MTKFFENTDPFHLGLFIGALTFQTCMLASCFCLIVAGCVINLDDPQENEEETNLIQ